VADLQAEIPAVAEEMVASGAETGLQVTVHQRSQVVGMVGANGSAAYAYVDRGLAVAVMRNGPAAAGLAAVTRIDRIIAEEEEHR
jgi:hypothetical protein